MRSGNFVFTSIERVIYGQPAAQVLRTEVDRLRVKHVFLIVSGTMNRTTNESANIREALGNRYAGFFDRIPPHTPREAVLEAAGEAKKVNTDLIVTFGGGSVTDAGKLVQLALQHNITDVDHFDAFRVVVKSDGTNTVPEFAGPSVRQIAIPTTLSGGEFQPSAGCTDSRSKVKHSYRHALLVPRVTIFDPLPTIHTPLWVWLSSGIRAVDHAVEGLCSAHSNPISDASFVQSLNLLSRGLPQVKRDPRDFDARLDCQLGVWLAMAGRQGGVPMGASHAIGHTLGGTCGVPHGHTSCVMLPNVLRYNLPVNEDRQRVVAKAMGHPNDDASSVVAALVADLWLPSRLADVGVASTQFSLIAEHAMSELTLHTNPRKITKPDQVMEILNLAA